MKKKSTEPSKIRQDRGVEWAELATAARADGGNVAPARRPVVAFLWSRRAAAPHPAPATLAVRRRAARLRGLPLRPVPLLSRYLRPSSAYRVLTLFVVALTVLREGGCDNAALGYDVFRSSSDSTYHSNSSSVSSSDGGDSRMAGAPIYCTASCTASSATCNVAAEALCGQPRSLDAKDWELGPVSINVRLAFEDPFCYVPLFKSSQLTYSANASLSRGSKDVSLSLDGTVDLEATGPMSCHSFRKKAARIIRDQVVQTINETLESN
jgi:hypothetical protein